MNRAWLLNSLWMWQCQPAVSAMRKAAECVEVAQTQVLAEILRHACRSEFGRRFRFDRIRCPREYQRQVPLAVYDDLAPWIDRAADGQARILSDQPIRLFQPTSGSSGAEKLIPYTGLLQRQFQRALQAWIGDMLAGYGGVRQGKAYWSISPAAQAPRATRGGTPIGFDQDVNYLNPLAQRLASGVLAVPGQVARLRHIDDFRYTTLVYLLACHDLALMSVWSPTFLTSLLAPLDAWFEQITFDIARGCLTLPSGNSQHQLRIEANPRRAQQLKTICRTQHTMPSRLRAIWPQLALISCWCDGSSSLYRQQVEFLFPDVSLQPKGLIATEGIVSIPLVQRDAAALAIRSHFFEFLPCDPQGQLLPCEIPLLAHELQHGEHYQVVLTTGGGLYRYALGDLILVTGFWESCPLVRFVGRASGTCDLVGEKLTDMHVRSVLDEVSRALGIAPRFAMLAPDRARRAGYLLFVECEAMERQRLRQFVVGVERGLRRNPHYDYAVTLGQLRPLEVRLLAGPPGVGGQIYQRALAASGMKLGDIKPLACDGRLDWPTIFADHCEPLAVRPPSMSGSNAASATTEVHELRSSVRHPCAEEQSR